MPSAHALIIATDSYQDTALQQLRGPVRDADELARTLADPAIGAYTVRTVLNQPTYLIAEEVEAFFADRLREDLLLLYFSCHGLKDDAGRLYFAGINTRLKRLAATGLASSFVNERMDASRSRKIVLLLDCCYSGAFAKGLLARAGPTVDVQERFTGRGRVVITASTAMEYAFEVSTDTAISGAGTPSLFTSAVVRGLRTGEADLDADGRVSVHELYDYVFEQVQQANPGQTPSMISNIQGDLYFATSPGQPAPAPSAHTDQTLPADPTHLRPETALIPPSTAPEPSTARPPSVPTRPNPVRDRLPRRKRLLAGVGALIAASAVLLAVVLHRGPERKTGASAPSVSASASAPLSSPITATASTAGQGIGGIVSSGTVTLADPTQGLDLIAGRLVPFYQSHIAWTITATLSIFDETTQGISHLPTGTDFDTLGAARLKSLQYAIGPANPPLPASQLVAGTVLAVRVDAATVAKLRIQARPSADGLPIRWITYRVS